MDNQDNKIRITVIIAGRPYSMKVKAADEPVILRLVKELNDKIRQFQKTYTNKDKQDLLAMALLTYSVDLHKARTKSIASSDHSTTQLASALQDIDLSLDNLLED
ncbi:MAG: cell division protein ZapA [Bacteroidota bacterium]